MALRSKGPVVTVNNTISNTSVNLITITEDKLENILIKHVAKLKKSHDWIGALAFFVTVLATLVTSDFHSTWGLDSAVFTALFILLLIISFGYLVYTVYNAIRNRDSVENIIRDIKNDLK